MTSDATTIRGEIHKLGHEGMTEKLKEVMEMQKIEETREIHQETETQKSKEGNELHYITNEHTQVEIGGENEVEHE